MDELFIAAGDHRIRTIENDPKPDPCPDCGRKYLVRESVGVRVEGRPDPVWEGCIDCWVKRTSPEMCNTFLKEKS